MISWPDRIPRTILLRSNHDPGNPARYVDRCWIRNLITTIGHFISNITIIKVQKLPGSIYWNMVCLVLTVCIFSMTLITYTNLSNMACPNRVVSWANTVCVHWTGHDALVSALINDVAAPPIVTSWIYIISLTSFIQSRPHNFNSKFPSEWFLSWFNEENVSIWWHQHAFVLRDTRSFNYICQLHHNVMKRNIINMSVVHD